MYLPELKPPTKAELDRSDKKRLAIVVYRDIERIVNALKGSTLSELKELHIELDGSYQTVIKNWGSGMYAFNKEYGFNYSFLGESSVRDNLAMMKGKLRGYMLQLDPDADQLSSYVTNSQSHEQAVRPSLHDIITQKKFDCVQEYNRIWKLFNTTDYVGKITSLSSLAEGCLQFFPSSFRGRALTLTDFNETHGFIFRYPNDSVTQDELITYCEYVITLCDHLQEYAYDAFDDGTNFLLDNLYQTVESCMDELGLVAAKRDNITIYVDKDPIVTTVAEMADESLSYDIQLYTHDSMKGNLRGKKSILKNLADEIEPERQKLNDLNKTWSSNLFQMLQKFVRHNNDNNLVINAMNAEETEKWYDEIYQMYMLAKLMLKNVSRSKEIKELLGRINESKN